VLESELHEPIRGCRLGYALRIEAASLAGHAGHEESRSTRNERVVGLSKRSCSQANERIEDGGPKELHGVSCQEKRNVVSILNGCLPD
jgi:hypothetical protein